MHEAFWNGLFDVRWEEAPLGAEAIRLTARLRERGYAERTCRDYGHAVVHLGRFLHEERGSDQVHDDEVVADFLGGHLPGCRCYRRPVGRGTDDHDAVQLPLGHRRSSQTMQTSGIPQATGTTSAPHRTLAATDDCR
jgi:hypothetical protein